YMITGWYSDKDDDPLYQPTSKDAWREKLNALGWALSSNTDDAEERLSTLEENRKRRERFAGLRVEYGDSTHPQPYTRWDNATRYPEQTTALNTIVESAAATSPGTASSNVLFTDTLFDNGALNIASTVLNNASNGFSSNRSTYFSDTIAGLSELAEQVFVAADQSFLRHWPRQMLCHSMTYGIAWKKQGGAYDPIHSGKPNPNNITISVGNTGVEALSALLAEKANQRNAERIYNSYHYGMLPELQEQDGLAMLESLLHSEDFESRPGGFVTDSIMEGDAFPNLSSTEANQIKKSPQANKRPIAQKTGKQAAWDRKKNSGEKNKTIKSTFYVRKDHIVYAKEDIIKRRGQPPFRKTPTPRRSVAIRKAMPRYWQPKDPVILFSEAKRGYKHGEDNRLTEEGLLLCRLTGETVTAVGLNIGHPINVLNDVIISKTKYDVKPQHLCDRKISSGQLPRESQALFNEALLLDLDNANIAANHVQELKTSGDLDKQYPKHQHTLDDLTESILTQRYQVKVSLSKNLYVNPELDAQIITNSSDIEGLQPSEFAQKPWRKPWMPLHMDWQVEWIPNADFRAGWSLDEHDYNTNAENDTQAKNTTDGIVYQGSTLLTPTVTRSMADRLTKFIEEEDQAEDDAATDIANDDQERVLGELREAINNLDVLSGNVSGFHDYLLAQVDDYQFSPLLDNQNNAINEKGLDQLEQEKRSIDELPKFPVRAGHFRIKKLRIVDTFGQFVDVKEQQLNNPIKAEDVESSPSTPDVMRLPPRIVQPSRLMFRMIQAENDQRDATKEVSPICGWLLPDHLDEALEFYDPLGNNLGQVQRRRPNSGDIISTSVEWQGVPGNPGSFGAPPNVGNSHLQGVVNGLLAAGEHDAQRALQTNAEEATTNNSKDTALGAMLRMIDSTLWTVDPLGREGNEHLSILVGRPLAVVRASLRLETMNLETQGDLNSTAFDVRLGELTRLGDGLVGYFINDDYNQFYPIHEEIANQTRPSRPHHGYLGAIQTTHDYYSSFASKAEPVKHPYINESPLVKVRPVAPGMADPASKSVMLTLIVDPRGGVHATSGILPRKKIELLREHVATALENMSITFRIGPILSNPETIRMPLPSEIQGNWSWVRKTGLTVWDETAVVDAVPDPKLTHTAAKIQEGWLKLSGAQKVEEES
ncbi:MAG: hypothetical protein KUG73_10325, partial [Pseudomonadales bacterium]|nr:hypothetical protein [Pseudomonadales bacterium]